MQAMATSSNPINISSTHKREWHCNKCKQTFECIPSTIIYAYNHYKTYCPVCCNLIAIKGYNDLTITNPEIARNLNDYNDAYNTSVNQKNMVEFKCKHGHVFKRSIQKYINDSSCPDCKKDSIAKISDNESMISTWDYDRNGNLNPYEIPMKSNKKYWWRCEQCLSSYEMSASNRARGEKCPKCKSKRLSASIIATVASKTPLSDKPEVSKYWDYDKNTDTPDDISYTSPSKRWFLCENMKHSSLKSVRNEVKQVNNSNSKPCMQCKHDNHETMDYMPSEILTMIADKDITGKLLSLPMNYSKKIEFKCNQCHQYFESRADSLLSLFSETGKYCPICGFRKLVPGVNDFATTQPELTKELVNKNEAKSFMQNDKNQRKWICVNNSSHIYSTTAAQRMNGVNCKICTAKKRGADRRKHYSAINPVPTWIIEYAIDEKNRKLASSLTASDSHNKVTIKYPECGHVRTTNVAVMRNYPDCPKCNSGQATSKAQEELYDYVRSILPESEASMVSYDDRTAISPKELDIYIPTRNIAIEYNGIYWHSCIPGSDDELEYKYKHYDKYMQCRQNGIQLLQFFDDDYMNHPEIIRNIIKSKLGLYDSTPSNTIYARKTTCSHIDYHDSTLFLDRNHIQGGSHGTVYLALKTDDGSTVAVMVITSITKDNGLLINRYATNCNVPGGFTKMLTHAINEYNPDYVYTFSDNMISDGGLYYRNGFMKDSEIKPDYYYVDRNDKRYHKFLFRKSRFEKDDNLIYDDNMTESELASINGLRRVYDAGKIKWIMRIK